MNYRHSYHAGNACDVVKHTLLISVLNHFQEKQKPFGVLDTHAGMGLYYLESPESAKTYEYEQGIKQIWKTISENPVLQSYLKIIRAFNSDGILKYYPGSPLIIDRFLQDSDHLICAELHPEDGKNLKNTLKHQKQISVHVRDGYLTPNAFLPFDQKRGLIIMDPPFEEKDDFDRMVRALKEGLVKFPQGVFMLWYPLKHQEQIATFYKKLSAIASVSITKTEFYFYKSFEDSRLNGSGMVFVNLPWGKQEQIEGLFTELARLLPFEQGSRWEIESLSSKSCDQ